MQRKHSPGIRTRHSRSCLTRKGGRCNCDPSYDAWVFDRRTGKKLWKTFPTLAAAKGWRADAVGALRRGRLQPTSSRTVEEAVEAWLTGAKAEPPVIVNRSGQTYKPSTLRQYERDLRHHILPEFRGMRLGDLRRADLQRLIDEMRGAGLSGTKVHNVIMALKVVIRHALERDEMAVDPTSHLRLPNGHKVRERTADANEAAELLAALPKEDRALWATAFYAGLRRGELRALRFENVDLAAGIIRVRRSWDDVVGEIEPKSAKGRRTVPIVARLHDYLAEQKARTGTDDRAFVFASSRGNPFTPSYIRKRANEAWAAENKKRAKKKLAPLVPIGLHECRHTFVSLMHDAGLSLERIGDYVGHSSTYMTDRYRHLLKGHEDEARKLFDDYLSRADTANRLEQLEN